MNTRLLAMLVAAVLPGLAFAQAPHNYQCSHGDLQRRVVIFYETGVTVPCEVHYFKDTEMPGETQVLWRALNEAGYCERMADSFIDKLKGMGWDCGMAEAAEPAMEAEEGVDDTAALVPVGELEPTED